MAFSVTFGECVESHYGMEKTGELAESGFPVSLLEKLERENPWDAELVYLHSSLPEELQLENQAAVLILRGGIELLQVSEDLLTQEMRDLEPDKFAVFRGQVKNKRARWNLCFADFSQQADFQAGKGTVVDFENLPLLGRVRTQLGQLIGETAQGLYAELNVYYDLSKCGIGFHGDTERKKVICLRLGESHPIDFQWFHRSRPLGERISLELNAGDIYMMSEKAVGCDWKKTSLHTLRHAAGAPKYRKTKYD